MFKPALTTNFALRLPGITTTTEPGIGSVNIPFGRGSLVGIFFVVKIIVLAVTTPHFFMLKQGVKATRKLREYFPLNDILNKK